MFVTAADHLALRQSLLDLRVHFNGHDITRECIDADDHLGRVTTIGPAANGRPGVYVPVVKFGKVDFLVSIRRGGAAKG